jgi:hypothetical protein
MKFVPIQLSITIKKTFGFIQADLNYVILPVQKDNYGVFKVKRYSNILNM